MVNLEQFSIPGLDTSPVLALEQAVEFTKKICHPERSRRFSSLCSQGTCFSIFMLFKLHHCQNGAGENFPPYLLASPLEEIATMEQPSLPNLGARRDQDIALDLLKFVAVTAGVGRPAAPTAGFVAGSVPKPEEQVTHLLELYSRCLHAVQGK